MHALSFSDSSSVFAYKKVFTSFFLKRGTDWDFNNSNRVHVNPPSANFSCQILRHAINCGHSCWISAVSNLSIFSSFVSLNRNTLKSSARQWFVSSAISSWVLCLHGGAIEEHRLVEFLLNSGIEWIGCAQLVDGTISFTYISFFISRSSRLSSTSPSTFGCFLRQKQIHTDLKALHVTHSFNCPTNCVISPRVVSYARRTVSSIPDWSTSGKL